MLNGLRSNIQWPERYPLHINFHLDNQEQNQGIIEALKLNTSVTQLAISFSHLDLSIAENVEKILEFTSALSGKNMSFLSFIESPFLTTEVLCRILSSMRNTTILELNLNQGRVDQKHILDLMDEIGYKGVKKLSLFFNPICSEAIENEELLVEKFNDLKLEAIALSDISCELWQTISKIPDKKSLHTLAIEPKDMGLFNDFSNIEELFLFCDDVILTNETINKFRSDFALSLFGELKHNFLASLFLSSKKYLGSQPKNIKKLTITYESNFYGMDILSSFIRDTKSLKEFCLTSKSIKNEDWQMLIEALDVNTTIRQLSLPELKMTDPMTDDIITLLQKEVAPLIQLEINNNEYKLSKENLIKIINTLEDKVYFTLFLSSTLASGESIEVIKLIKDTLEKNTLINIKISYDIDNPHALEKEKMLIKAIQDSNQTNLSMETIRLFNYIKESESDYMSCQNLMAADVLRISPRGINPALFETQMFTNFSKKIALFNIATNKIILKITGNETAIITKNTLGEIMSFLSLEESMNLLTASTMNNVIEDDAALLEVDSHEQIAEVKSLGDSAEESCCCIS